MDEPYIKVELVDGTNTWVAVCPIHQHDHIGAQHSAADAFMFFMRSLARDEDALDAHLARYGPPRVLA